MFVENVENNVETCFCRQKMSNTCRNMFLKKHVGKLFSNIFNVCRKNVEKDKKKSCTFRRHFFLLFTDTLRVKTAPEEHKMSTEKGYPLEKAQSPYAALAFAAASFAGVMSIGI